MALQPAMVDQGLSERLYNAAFCGKIDLVKTLLVNNRADVNDTAEFGLTALYAAAQEGHLETVRLLIAHGADIHKAELRGQTPLSIAVQNNHIKVVKELLAHKGSVNQTTFAGMTPIILAAHTNQRELVALLLSHGGEINKGRADGATALLHVCQHGHLEMAQDLVASKASVNQANNYGESPLYSAARGGHEPIVRLLIEHAADINVCSTSDSLTPLAAAVEKGHIRTVDTLLKAKALPKISQTKTEVDFSIFYQRKEMTKLIKTHGGKGFAIKFYNALKSPYLAAHVERISLAKHEFMSISDKEQHNFIFECQSQDQAKLLLTGCLQDAFVVVDTGSSKKKLMLWTAAEQQISFPSHIFGSKTKGWTTGVAGQYESLAELCANDWVTKRCYFPPAAVQRIVSLHEDMTSVLLLLHMAHRFDPTSFLSWHLLPREVFTQIIQYCGFPDPIYF